MKKFILACVVLCMTTSWLAAQIKLNPHVGLNAITSEAVVDGIRVEGKVGFTAGVFLRIGPDNQLFFVPGFQYAALSLAGFQNDPNVTLDLGEATAKYIKIPLNMGINLTGEGGVIRVYVQGGLTPSFTVKQEALFEGIQEEIENNSYVLGGNIGLGIDVIFGTLFINYEGGFTKVIKAADTNTNILTVTAGVRL